MLHLLSNVFPFVCRRSDITPRKDKIHCRYPCQGSGAAYNSKGRSTVYFDLLGGGGPFNDTLSPRNLVAPEWCKS